MQKAADTLHTRSLSAANHLESQSFYFILFTSYISHVDRSTAHATRSGDGRQEGGERGYYNLHRNLNQSLLLHNI